MWESRNTILIKPWRVLHGFLPTLYNFNNLHNGNYTKQKNLLHLVLNEIKKIFLFGKIQCKEDYKIVQSAMWVSYGIL